MPTPVSVTASITWGPGVEFGVHGFDRDLAALRHGVARVHHEVHQDLLNLAGVRIDLAKLVRGQERQVDALAKQASQHSLHAESNLVEVKNPRLEHLLAAEGEELAGQADGSLTRPFHLLEVGLHRIARLEVAKRKGRAAQDYGEDVVEVVCDAARQATNGLHLLRLPKLRLQAFAFRQVEDYRDVVTAVERRNAHQDGHSRPISADVFLFPRSRHTAGPKLLSRGHVEV
jgi:hypothetical protein